MASFLDRAMDSLVVPGFSRIGYAVRSRSFTRLSEMSLVGKTVVLHVVGNDVIHSFSVASLGFRMDAVPGRLNQTWFKAEKEGIYYGQCSRLCGQNHAFMPVAVRAVSPEKYQAWLADAKKKFASTQTEPVKVAAHAAQ